MEENNYQTFLENKKNADNGNDEAMIKVADSYLSGEIVNRDLNMAIKYYHASAAKKKCFKLQRTWSNISKWLGSR